MARSNDWNPLEVMDFRHPAGKIAWGLVAFIAAGIAALSIMLAPVALRQNPFSPITDFLAKRRAQQAIAAMMIDPDSAQFRNTSVIHTADNGTLICGEVNGRNRLGGLGGYNRFVVSTATGQAVMDQQSPPSQSQQLDDEIACDNAAPADKSLYCERSKRTTEEYKAGKLYAELAAACPVS